MGEGRGQTQSGLEGVVSGVGPKPGVGVGGSRVRYEWGERWAGSDTKWADGEIPELGEGG